MQPSNSNVNAHFDRRTMLRRGALIGGALWVAPVVQVLGARSADAASGQPTSTGSPTATGTHPTGTASPTDTTSVGGTSTGGTSPTGTQPAAVLPDKIGSLPTGGGDTEVLGGKLAQTGAAVGTIAVVGAAAIAGGAAVKRAGRTPAAVSGEPTDGTDGTGSSRSGRRH